jgi:hypothetical protein
MEQQGLVIGDQVGIESEPAGNYIQWSADAVDSRRDFVNASAGFFICDHCRSPCL